MLLFESKLPNKNSKSAYQRGQLLGTKKRKKYQEWIIIIKCFNAQKHIPSIFETWWTTTSFVFVDSNSFNMLISGTSSWFKLTNFKTAPVFWATSCQGTIALWCSATVSTICQKRTSDKIQITICSSIDNNKFNPRN